MAEAAALSALMQVMFEKLPSVMLQQLGKMLGVGVRRELEKLKSTLTAVQAVLSDAEEKQEKNAALRDWLKKLTNAAYDAEDVLDDVDYERLWLSSDENKVSRIFSSHNPAIFRAKMARKVKEVLEKFDEIAAERSKFGLSTDSAAVVNRPLEWRETHSYNFEPELIGREEDKRMIAEILVSQGSSSSGSSGGRPRVLPIIGMGGIGKTTLTRMVYNEQEVMAHFEPRIWVCVSDDFNIPRIAREIITSAGGNVEPDASMDQLQCGLRDKLAGKRYLLVLDDVWNEKTPQWDALSDLLTFGVQGSAVVVTTRSDKVAKVVATLHPYRLTLMSEEDCWTLFEHKAFSGPTAKSPELVEIGKKIATKCKGLPLATKVIGGMMRLKTEKREWLNVLESEVWELEYGKDEILPVLKLSYHQLSPHLKRCFAFCAIFPKDHKIGKEMLIQLWIANGFIPTEERLELEEKGDEIVGELTSRSFFQEEKSNTAAITIHDLLHDLAQSILNGGKSKQISDIRYLVTTKDTTAASLSDSLLNSSRTLHGILQGNYPMRDIDVCLSTCPRLGAIRMLDLSGTSRFPIMKDHNLRHLRYLDISYSEIEMLPEAVCQLFHLQTLKMEHCSKLHELPKGMKNMCNLRHLDNSGCDSLASMPRGLDQLSNLQTLAMFVASQKAGSGSIAELKDLNLGGKLMLRNLDVVNATDAKEANLGLKKKIRSLELIWRERKTVSPRDNDEEVMGAFQLPPDIRKLNISWYEGQKSPNGIIRCESLQKLKLRNCSALIDIPCLPSLKFLVVSDCSLLSPPKGFYSGMNSLERLEIQKSDKMVDLLEREDNVGDSGCLSVLKILCCNTRIFSSESCLGMWKNLKSLQTLSFVNCSELISLPDELLRGLSSLKNLQLDKCQKLTGSAPSPSVVGGRGKREEEEGGLRLQHLTSLQFLTINDCPNLDIGVCLDGLQGLRELDIGGCEKFLHLLDGLGGFTALQSLKLQHLTALTSLPDGLGGLTSLTDLWIHECAALTSLPDGLGGLTSLIYLSIDGCTALTSLPDGLGGLTSLIYLTIDGCTALTSLPDGLGALTQLQMLSITGCPMLSALPMGLQHRLPHLLGLWIRRCPGLQTRFQRGGEYSQLISSIQHLDISD